MISQKHSSIGPRSWRVPDAERGRPGSRGRGFGAAGGPLYCLRAAQVEVVDGPAFVFSEQLACARCGISFPEISPRMFSFNNPYGACPECSGIGTPYELPI